MINTRYIPKIGDSFLTILRKSDGQLLRVAVEGIIRQEDETLIGSQSDNTLISEDINLSCHLPGNGPYVLKGIERGFIDKNVQTIDNLSVKAYMLFSYLGLPF